MAKRTTLNIVWCRACHTNHAPGQHSSRQAPLIPSAPKRKAKAPAVPRPRQPTKPPAPKATTKPARKRKHRDLSGMTAEQRADHRRAQVRKAVQRHREKAAAE